MVAFNLSTHKAVVTLIFFLHFQCVEEFACFQEFCFNQRPYQIKPLIHPIFHLTTDVLEEVEENQPTNQKPATYNKYATPSFLSLGSLFLPCSIKRHIIYVNLSQQG